jgi:pantoate kinase
MRENTEHVLTLVTRFMTQPAITAFCPGHISGYFRRITGDSLVTTGSIGAGIVIGEGVTASIRPSRVTSITIRRRNDRGAIVTIADRAPPIESAMEQIGVTATVETECRLPIGAGFGLSAAALLATLAALNAGLELDLKERELFRIGHEIEVQHRTGLGDVAACQGGGRVIRHGAGIDAPIDRYWDLPGGIHAISFGPIHTPSVLGSDDRMEQVRAVFPPRAPRNAEEFFTASREFAEKSGLVTPQVAAVFAACDRNGVMAGMTMLGNGVFGAGPGARAVLETFGTVYSFGIAYQGVRVMEAHR